MPFENSTTWKIAAKEVSNNKTSDMSHPFEYIASDYEFQHGVPTVLGRGGFGVVCEVLQKSSFSPLAIKRVSLRRTEPSSPRPVLPLEYDGYRVKLTVREIIHQKDCAGFPYVVKLLDWYRSQDGFDAYFVLEKWPTTLLGHIQRPLDFHFRGRILPIVQTPRVIMCQLLIALDFLHSRNIFHRDLSLGNIFVDASEGRVSLADFGASKMVTDDTPSGPDSIGYGTLPYRAPEVLCECSANPQLRWAADIWSLGCIFMELLTGAPFLASKDPRNQVLCLLRLFNESDPTDLGNLMKEHQCSQRFANFFASNTCREALQAYKAVPTLADRMDAMSARLRSTAPASVEGTETFKAETEATIQVATELIPAMLVLDPARRARASDLLGKFTSDTLCNVLIAEYDGWKQNYPLQMPPTLSANPGFGVQTELFLSLFSRVADAAVPLE